MIYHFASQHALGQKYESILDAWLSKKHKIIDVSSDLKYQKAGIDRLIIRPDNSIISVEYKCDAAAQRTGNLFFETISNDRKNVPGWGWASQADYWIFLIPHEEILIFQPGQLRSLVWREKDCLQEKAVSNKNYKTLGYPIPLFKARTKAFSVFKFAHS